MKRQLALFTITALVSFALAQADPHHPETAPATQDNPQSQALLLPGETAYMPMAQMMAMMQMMHGMMGPGLMMLDGAPFEQAFLSMMVPHHRAAVTLARDVLGKTQDPQIRGWASAIIRDQERQLAQIEALLAAQGGTNLAAQHFMTQSLGGMMGDQGAGGMMQAPVPSGMMQQPGTGNAPQTSVSLERAFVERMIPHHAQAIEMAVLALQRARNPEVIRLAGDIVRTQAEEIYEMRLWLAKLP
ncbi:hypothetical protein CSW30_01645 [Thermus scotoductus]|uniref:DUF305 domain-containing protein n=1 Tax=Thermus scotoductus TaxID=37636 RepID=A0A430UTL9_THESC|nr:hypothetical protein CSW30_01645 [Thermus scotoductus]RTI12179.1 hypothetical protein CSW27_10855 [Thermus scotoductus]